MTFVKWSAAKKLWLIASCLTFALDYCVIILQIDRFAILTDEYFWCSNVQSIQIFLNSRKLIYLNIIGNVAG